MAVTTLTLITIFQATPASAQRWSVELRGSGQISTQDAASETHENGYGLEASVQYRFLEHVSAYAGWAYTHFAALEAIAGPDMDLEETGYVLGLRFEHPIRDGAPTRYWVRTGATYDHIELENADGDIVDDSGHGLGWELGAGLAFPIRDRWTLTPGLRYRALSRDLEIGAATTPVELRYVGFELGIRRSLWAGRGWWAHAWPHRPRAVQWAPGGRTSEGQPVVLVQRARGLLRPRLVPR